MQCLQLTRGEPPATTVDVALSGIFDKSYGYVTIDGTKYASSQTVMVAKGTSVTVHCSGGSSVAKKNSYIRLNGTKVAQGTTSAAAEYTFAVTDNCTIKVKKIGKEPRSYFTADITMPA